MRILLPKDPSQYLFAFSSGMLLIAYFAGRSLGQVCLVLWAEAVLYFPFCYWRIIKTCEFQNAASLRILTRPQAEDVYPKAKILRQFGIAYACFLAVYTFWLFRSFEDLALLNRGTFFSIVAAAGYTAAHLISYLGNFLAKKEFERADPEALSYLPFKRLANIHTLIAILVSLRIYIGATSDMGIAMVITLKLLLDQVSHLWEHVVYEATPRMPGAI